MFGPTVPRRTLKRSILALFLLAAVAGPAATNEIAAGTDAGAPIAGSDTSTIAIPPGYGKPNQSRIWFNSRQDRWDALVPRNDGGSSASDHYILLDVTGAQTFTDVEVENRNTARPDAFWDDAAGRLYVLGSHGSVSRIWQLAYDDGTDTYSIEPDVNGLTVTGINHASDPNRPATLYVTPNGRLWVGVMKENALTVQTSTDGGRTWLSSPVVLDTSVLLGVTGWVHFEDAGETYAGLFAGENGEGGSVDTLFYYWFIDQDADAASLSNWTNDSASIPVVGLEKSDDHVRAARDPEGNQYFVVKTESGAPDDPLIKLFKRTPQGVWSQFAVTRAQDSPEQSRPSLVVDAPSDTIRVYTTDTGGGNGHRVLASLDSLEWLGSAPLETILSSPGRQFDDLIAPRNGADPSGEIVVLAHNETDRDVWYAVDRVGPACMAERGGTPEVLAMSIPLAGQWNQWLRAKIHRPDPELQIGSCPLIAMVPSVTAFGLLEDLSWAAERLARDGYVVIVTLPLSGSASSIDRAVVSSIDFMISEANPWPAATDTEVIGAVGAPYSAPALTLTQVNDPRLDAIVAWDNLSRSESGDRGQPNCLAVHGTLRTPTIPAMGHASDGCSGGRDTKKTAYGWWRNSGVETMEVVFGGSTSAWWSRHGSEAQHDLIHYYTVAWFDRWLKNDASATERLLAVEVLGTPLEDVLDDWYRSAAFFDGYDCPDLRGGCDGDGGLSHVGPRQ